MINFDAITKQLSKLPPSSVVVVEVASPVGQKVKFRSIFIGFVPERFVLLQMPDVSKNRRLVNFLVDNAKCTVRALSEGIEGAVIAFNTHIKSLLKTPAPMLVMQIPEKVALQSLRKTTRIETNIDIELFVSKLFYSATMIDLSAYGCLISIDKTLEVNVRVAANIKVKILDKSFQNVDEIKGTIRNIRNQPHAIELGIAFDDTEQLLGKQLLDQVLLT